VVLLSPACKRDALKEPSPVGPSTIALTFTLTANPNVVCATTRRPTSEIRVVIKDGNSPVKDAIVYFTIRKGPGYFYDYTQRVVILSNENGVASVVYLGPLKSEIAADELVVIRAQLETITPNEVYKDVEIRVLRAPD
jgi:hypothetical protein